MTRLSWTYAGWIWFSGWTAHAMWSPSRWSVSQLSLAQRSQALSSSDSPCRWETHWHPPTPWDISSWPGLIFKLIYYLLRMFPWSTVWYGLFTFFLIIIPQNRKITESQNCRGWKGSLETIYLLLKYMPHHDLSSVSLDINKLLCAHITLFHILLWYYFCQFL